MVMCACHEDHSENQQLAMEVQRLQNSYEWIADSFAFTGHELRNGLLRLRLVTEKMERELGLSAEQKQTVDRAIKVARRLELMALNCLKLAEIESGSFEPACYILDPVAKIIEPLIDDYADMLELRQQTVEVHVVDDNLTIHADPDLLRLVVNNLLNNAIKYGEHGGKIILRTRLVENNACEISVWNSGEGITLNLCERIFERFQTGGGVSLAPSTGIGLYLVKRIVEAHQGAVYCESKVGEWARFRIQLPN